jgi:hypothetical protein
MTPAAAPVQGMIAMQEESGATANVELMAPSLTVNYDNLNLVWPSHDEPSVIRCALPAPYAGVALPCTTRLGMCPL